MRVFIDSSAFVKRSVSEAGSDEVLDWCKQCGRLYPTFLIFLLGLLTGALCTVGLASWAAFNLADWLVVDDKPHRADVAIVLGGGGGSRLRTGLDLYDRGMVDALVLVDTKASAWDNMLARMCPDCKAGGKPMAILTGSTSTLTDAVLVREYCLEHGIKQILVVTDPYHTRRASIIFNRRLADTSIGVMTVSSGDYSNRLPPTEQWWHDEPTLRMVWAEVGKIGAFILTSLSDPG